MIQAYIILLCVARELGGLAITTKSNAAALGERLDNRAEIKGHLNSETSDGIDLGTVVDGIGVDSAGDVDGVAPSGIDLNDGGAGVHDERTVAVVRALAGPDEVPGELDVVHAVKVVEIPAERTPAVVVEALHVARLSALGDCASPVSLVVNNRLAVLDNIPGSLAHSDDGGNVDVSGKRTRARVRGGGAAGVLYRLARGDSELNVSKKKAFVAIRDSKASNSQKSKEDEFHFFLTKQNKQTKKK